MLVEKNLNFESCKTFSKTEESEIHVLRKRDCIFDKKTCLIINFVDYKTPSDYSERAASEYLSER